MWGSCAPVPSAHELPAAPAYVTSLGFSFLGCRVAVVTGSLEGGEARMSPSGSVLGTVRGTAAMAWGRLQEKWDILWKVRESRRPRPLRRTPHTVPETRPRACTPSAERGEQDAPGARQPSRCSHRDAHTHDPQKPDCRTAGARGLFSGGLTLGGTRQM